MDGQAVSVMSPGYHSNGFYDNHQSCTWLIKVISLNMVKKFEQKVNFNYLNIPLKLPLVNNLLQNGPSVSQIF